MPYGCYVTRNLPLADADVHVLQLTRVDVLTILEIVQRVEHAIINLKYIEDMYIYYIHCLVYAIDGILTS